MVNDQMVHYIDVILPLAIRDCYTYSIPDGLSIPAPGTRVLVPLMRKQVRGIVLREHTEEVSSDFAAKIKPIFSVSETAPTVSAEQLALWQWMSSYYMCTLGEVMAAALPSGLDNRLLNPPKRRRTHIAPYDGPVEPMHPLTSAQAKSVDEIGQLWSSGKQIVLLHGVTSSGKTDMYIHLIQAQL
jgi:primosomal protein N' (replication factor Y)